MSFFEKFIEKLPSSLNSEPGTNFEKLAKFLSLGFDDIQLLFNNIQKYRNIDQAKGKLLDRIGEKYDVKRGPADDDFYRLMIKSKLAIRKGDTSINGLLTTMQNALGINVFGVKLKPIYLEDGTKEPLSLRITDVPLRFAKSEFEQEFMMKQIESSVAVGIHLQDMQFKITSLGNWYAGAGMATVECFHIDDSIDYGTFKMANIAGVGATGDFSSLNELEDSRQYAASLIGSATAGAVGGFATITNLDDQHDSDFVLNGHVNGAIVQQNAQKYNLTDQHDISNAITGHLTIPATAVGIAEITFTDQFDSKFEISDQKSAGAAVEIRENIELSSKE